METPALSRDRSRGQEHPSDGGERPQWDIKRDLWGTEEHPAEDNADEQCDESFNYLPFHNISFDLGFQPR
jgi:hypothetical protein